MNPFFYCLCCKNSYVPLSSLIARSPRRSTNNRLGTSSWNYAKAGGVWVYKSFYWPFSSGLCLLITFSFFVKYFSCYIYFSSSYNTSRFKKDNCLFFNCTYGICYRWLVFAKQFRYNWWYFCYGKPRLSFKWFIFLYRYII